MTGQAIEEAASRPIWPDLVDEDDEGPFLHGGRCRACGFLTLGVRDVCPGCWGRGTMSMEPIGRRGTLYTWTMIHQVPAGYEHPFAVGYIDLEDRVRVFAHLETGARSPAIGDPVELTIAQLRLDADGTPLFGPRYRKAQ